MLVDVVRRTETKDQVEVDFPLFTHTSYFFDEGNGYDTWQRIEADGKCFQVTKSFDRDGEIEFEFGLERLNLSRDLPEYMDKNDWNNRVVTEADFIKAVAEAKAELAKFPV